MTTTTMIRARFDGRVLIPLEPVSLPEDRVLEVQVTSDAEPAPGSPAALLKVLAEPRIASPEDMDALEREIAASRLPPRQHAVFDLPPGE